MLTSLTLHDFTVFADTKLSFGALNVIHGENSSGKTHVLKAAYSLAAALHVGPNKAAGTTPTKKELGPRLSNKLAGVFRPDKDKLGRLVSRARGEGTAKFTAEFKEAGTVSGQLRRRSTNVDVTTLPSRWLDQAPVYFPTRELLSVYPGFVSLYETQAVPFDETWRDTCLLLGVPIARGPRKKDVAELLNPIEQAIGCRAVLEAGRFYLQGLGGELGKAKVEVNLAAEGYRRVAMVTLLIANGSLNNKGFLFWDEPEANLNPRLVKRVAPLLLDLAAGGVQVFVATHSLFLMRELEIARFDREVATRYIGLKPSPHGVDVTQGDSPDESGDIAALDESLEQSERYLQAEPHDD